MAISFSFDKVNRIIEVDGDTVVTVQQIINAIRDWEDELVNFDIPKVADASGKEDLGGGEFNTITLKLLNWKLKREASASPIVFTVRGGNFIAVDAYGDEMNPFEPSTNVSYDRAKSSSGTMIQDADIDAIKAKTDALPSTPASETTLVEVKAKTNTLPTTPADEATLVTVRAKTDKLPSDPAGIAALAAAHGSSSWEGATPSQVWGHDDRRLSSRVIASGEHLTSEEQLESHDQKIKGILDTIKGLGFESEEDALRVIRRLVESGAPPKAHFDV